MSQDAPKNKDIVYLLKRYRDKEGWADSDLSAAMTSWGGWAILERMLSSWFLGKSRPSQEMAEYVKNFLVFRYDEYGTIP